MEQTKYDPWPKLWIVGWSGPSSPAEDISNLIFEHLYRDRLRWLDCYTYTQVIVVFPSRKLFTHHICAIAVPCTLRFDYVWCCIIIHIVEFSAFLCTQILCEINLQEPRISKNAIFYNYGVFNFDLFVNFSLSNVLKFIKNPKWESLNALKWRFLISRKIWMAVKFRISTLCNVCLFFQLIDFTWNHFKTVRCS